MCTKPARFAQAGLTLVELLVFIVIVGVGLAGILNVLNFTLKNSANPMLVKQQIAVAESLLEEIESKPFTYCDPSDPNVTTLTSPAVCAVPMVMGPPLAATGKSRYDQTSPFTQVADYHGLNMNAGILNPGDGSVIAGLGNYTASVVITQAGATAPTNVGAADAVLKIDVTVSAPGTTPMKLTGYRYRYAPNSP